MGRYRFDHIVSMLGREFVTHPVHICPTSSFGRATPLHGEGARFESSVRY